MTNLSDVNQLIDQLNQGSVDFKKVIQLIEDKYNFTPTAFTNGETVNDKNTNNGSCKIFAFGQLNNLSEQATLNAFGDFYTIDVLQNPEKDDHQNIRNFITFGWKGISFEQPALALK